MMTRIQYVLIAACVFSFAACKKEAGITEEQKDKFVKFYGTAAEGVDIARTADGGFVMLGTIEGNGSKDIFLVKADAHGNQQWSKSFNGSSGTYDDIASAITIMNDGNFAIVGTTLDTIGSTFLLVTDPAGRVIHRKLYHSDVANEDEQGFDVLALADGRILTCGERLEGGFLSGCFRIIDPADDYTDIEFLVPRGGQFVGDPKYHMSFRSMALFRNRIAISGITDAGPDLIKNSDNIFRLTVDVGSSIAATDGKEEGGNGEDGAHHVLGDGNNMIVTGYLTDGSTQKLYVASFDYTDDVTSPANWIHVSQNANEMTGSHLIKSGNGYVVCGYIVNSSHGRQLYMAELAASDGSVLWENNYGYTELDEAKSVVETADGGYALFGTSSDERGNRVMCMIKTDARGNVK